MNWYVSLRKKGLALRTPEGGINPVGVVISLAAVAIASVAIWFSVRPHDNTQDMVVLQKSYTYFYDLGDQHLFVAESSNVPPFPAPSGKVDRDGQPMGVRAKVFSCGSCDNESERFLAYLEKYTPEAHETLAANAQPSAAMGTQPAATEPGGPGGPGVPDPSLSGIPEDPDAIACGPGLGRVNASMRGFASANPTLESELLVSLPEGSEWVPLSSKKGNMITATPQQHCGAATPTPCVAAKP